MLKILFVGEAYGKKEKLFDHAFVGPSGVELCRMISQAGIAPDIGLKHPNELDLIKYWAKLKENHKIEVTNVFPLQPEDNKIELFFGPAKTSLNKLPPLRSGKYLLPEMFVHLERLWNYIEANQPNLIVALGNTACWAVLGESGIKNIRGTIKPSPKFNCKVLPTYHPAAVLRDWAIRPIVVSDLEKANKESETKQIKRIERWVTIEPTLEEIENWIKLDAEFYAIDIETPISLNVKLSSQISMIGFARNPHDALVIPFVDETSPTWSYWKTIEDEMTAWRYVDTLLKKEVPKVFQNGVFDLSHLLRIGLRPTMCEEDTMLLHHSIYPEMLKGLGFLGSIYSDEIAWKTMRTKGNNLKRDE